ncbi:MAG: radical SAM protein [Deltaproteobacteria bacterium]|nr:radical SAM protein [Deltaproteobacteria bacterium]
MAKDVLAPGVGSHVDRWSHISALEALLGDEQGTLYKDAPLRVALCYPSPYSVGMSSLGFQTMYREIHAHDGATAERAFLPDDVPAFRASGTELMTCESQSPASQASIVAFSVAYELEVTGVLEMLSLAGLPLLREERGPSHPLVVAGGPLTFSNPAPLEPFVDLLVLGEADQTLHQLLDAARESGTREGTLRALEGKAGFYAPGRGAQQTPVIACALDERLPARSQIITPHTELRSMFLVEAERGCSRGCTYCVMRRTTNGGMRLVSPERVLAAIPQAARKVGLVGAAVTDHPRLPQLIEALVASGREVGVSSMRAERLTPELVGLLARGGYRTLTVALDGASRRLRETIDRRTDEKDIVRAAELAKAAGMKRLKVYLMVGLPGETDEDLDELTRFARELASVLPVSLGVSPFCAKRNTPLDGAPFEPIASLEGRLKRLQKGLRGRVEVRPTSARWSWVEYMLAQCGPEAGLAALDAWRLGGGFSDWKRAFQERGATPSRASCLPRMGG